MTGGDRLFVSLLGSAFIHLGLVFLLAALTCGGRWGC